MEHDWEKDARPFADVLKDWIIRRNNGRLYGARPLAADLLAVNPTSLRNWLGGMPCLSEPSIRRLMNCIDALKGEVPFK